MREWHKNRLLSRPRFCIFCGKSPRIKTREHIVPKWLIELTGDLHRMISMGPFMSQQVISGNNEFFRQFDFNSLTFPSCDDCNNKSAALEESVKPLIIDLINRKPLSASDFNVIFDWFDKVRVGLWLGFHHFLDRNFWGINPHFFIQDRIGAADRALIIYEVEKAPPGIRFVGVNTPAFAHVPSCFTLIINQWFLVNISYQLLFSKAAGLPHAKRMEFGKDEALIIEISPGKSQLSCPLLSFPLPKNAVIVAQPILSESITEQVQDLFLPEYLNTIILRDNKVKPLIQTQGTVSVYPSDKVTHWQPKRNDDYNSFVYKNAIQTLKLQNHLIERVPVSPKLDKNERQFYETEFRNCIKANHRFISLFRDWKNK